MGSYSEPYKEGRPIKKGAAGQVAEKIVEEAGKAGARTHLTESGALRKGSFKLRNGAGKMDSYTAFQRQGLISPAQRVEGDDPKMKKAESTGSSSEAYKDQKAKHEKEGFETESIKTKGNVRSTVMSLDTPKMEYTTTKKEPIPTDEPEKRKVKNKKFKKPKPKKIKKLKGGLHSTKAKTSCVFGQKC